MLQIIKLLIKAGASTDIATDDGLTPLHYAARFKISCKPFLNGGNVIVNTYKNIEDTKDGTRISISLTS